MKVTFYGGTGTVTGANFLLEAENLRVLIDCGMLQGTESAEEFNAEKLPYEPSSINYLLVTHAHMDHIGRIPKLVKDGFSGKIISTPPTKDLASLLLQDALSIIEMNERKTGTLGIYEKKDLEKAMSLWETLDYHEVKKLTDETSIYLYDSGHILGSAMIEITENNKKVVFTGDLGNSPSLLLHDTEILKNPNYIVMESVYGDRNHEPKEARREKLKSVISDTIKNKRTLIIPAFSLERTQEILYEMDHFFESGELKNIPVFLDSPLAIKVTKVFENYARYFKEEVRDEIKDGDGPFKFPKLKKTELSWESHKISLTPNPKIIIGGSGMSSGGRIVEHEKDFAPDENATILLVGYQSPGTLGRQFEDGAKKVKINGKEINVLAKIEKIEGYSSHKDSDHLVEFVEKASEGRELKKVFCVMGEPKSSLFLVQRLRDEINVNGEYPEYGSIFEIV